MLWAALPENAFPAGAANAAAAVAAGCGGYCDVGGLAGGTVERQVETTIKLALWLAQRNVKDVVVKVRTGYKLACTLGGQWLG